MGSDATPNLEYRDQAAVDLPHLGIPVRVWAYRSSAVVWLNKLWLLRHGYLKSLSPNDVARCAMWILQEFAYGIPLSTADRQNFSSRWRTCLVDRYGNSNGFARHGGSGRAGVFGRFQVKGIGPTPLVSPESDWLHSHGCLWLEEALRETVYSEVVRHELPHGAVPVIAVIDTGVSSLGDGSRYERRALLVRPFRLRAAHLDRATDFLPPGAERSAQEADYLRVNECWNFFQGSLAGGYAPIKFLRQLLHRMNDQLACAVIQRFYLCGVFPSSFAVDGAMLDFGGFRAVIDWRRTFGTSHLAPFGGELDCMQVIAHSLLHEAWKHCRLDVNFVETKSWLVKDYWSSFFNHLRKIFGNRSVAENLCVDMFATLYAAQQSCVRDLATGAVSEAQGVWRHRPLSSSERVFAGIADLEELVPIMLTQLREVATSDAEFLLLRNRILRLISTRKVLDRETLQGILFKFVAEYESDMEACDFDGLLSDVLTNGRRLWTGRLAELVAKLEIIGHACSSMTTCLVCRAPIGGHLKLVIEAAVVGSTAIVFNGEVTLGAGMTLWRPEGDRGYCVLPLSAPLTAAILDALHTNLCSEIDVPEVYWLETADLRLIKPRPD